jgi:hypothetical protein
MIERFECVIFYDQVLAWGGGGDYTWQGWTDSQDRVKGRFTSGNSYNRMSAPAAMGPEQLPDVKALAVGGGWVSTWYPWFVRGEYQWQLRNRLSMQGNPETRTTRRCEGLGSRGRGVPYLVSLLCEGGVTSSNSYNRMSAPADLGPTQLPEEKALAVGEGWGSTWYPCFVRGEYQWCKPLWPWDPNTA